jgi:hypothetical protein
MIRIELHDVDDMITLFNMLIEMREFLDRVANE